MDGLLQRWLQSLGLPVSFGLRCDGKTPTDVCLESLSSGDLVQLWRGLTPVPHPPWILRIAMEYCDGKRFTQLLTRVGGDVGWG